jgi:hypothetical protein
VAELKTRQTGASVKEFLDGIEDERKRRDAKAVAKILKRVTGAPPKMWGSSIVGYGHYHYVYDSGRENDWFLAGFSPRKQALTLYIMAGFSNYDDLMANLGKYKTGKSCLYVNKLEDIHLPTLKRLIRESVKYIRRTHKS